jgi:hypothetical protein
VSGKAPYHRGVRGSAALATRPLDADGPAAEAIPAGEMRRIPFAGELLGAVRVRASYAALPLDAFDRAGESLEAVEQAAYLQLLRLSVGEGRNWCRAAKRDLQGRLRLTERRLLRVLDALVAKGFAKPLHRDNRGTLWRVYLPREAAGERLGDDVIVGRAAELRVTTGGGEPVEPRPGEPRCPSTGSGRSARTMKVIASAAATSTATPTSTPPHGPRPFHHASTLARALAEARGRADAEGLAAAGREVDELLAEGASPERIAACIETVRRRAARAPAKESA